MSDLATFDPVSLEILWSRLIAVADEGAATLARVAFSPVARESNDLTTGIFDARGRSLAQASTATPLHTGVLSRTLGHFLRKFPLQAWQPGDVGISNDPWKGTGHRYDISVCMPVYHRGRLVAFAAGDSHSPDIGGLLGFSAEGRDVYEEGLGIPIMKVVKEGRINEELLDIIRENVRVPDLVLGDLYARLAAMDVMARRLVELLEEQGLAEIDTLSEAIQGRAEQAMRAQIAALPDGTYRHQLDADGFDEPLRLCVTARVEGDTITVDFAGSSPQSRRGINVVFNYTYAQTIFALKCLLDPDTPHNDGHARPVTVTAPEGCILNARYPAPVNGRAMVGHYIPNAVIAALAPALPGRAIADCGAPRHISSYHGRAPDGAEVNVDLHAAGGMGAGEGHDGLPCTPFPTNTAASPIEILEHYGLLLFWEKAIYEGSGGAGAFRGGDGQRIEIEVVSPHPVSFHPHADRMIYPPQGLLGGSPGARSAILVNGTPVHGKTGRVLEPGDRLSVRVAGGGGFGPPRERDAARLSRDVYAGLISPDEAARAYGWRREAVHGA